MSRLEDQRPEDRNLLALADRVGRNECGRGIGMDTVIGCFNEPTGNVIKESAGRGSPLEKVTNLSLLLSTLPCETEIRWISANVRLAALILEVDLRLIQRSAEEVIGLQLHVRSGRRADAD